MHKLLPFLLVAAVACNKRSARETLNLKEQDARRTALSATARLAVSANLEGLWRHTDTRYNRGDGTHFWAAIDPEKQTLVRFAKNQVIGGNHRYLGAYTAYKEIAADSLQLFGPEDRTMKVGYSVSGDTLLLHFIARETVTDRFVKQ